MNFTIVKITFVKSALYQSSKASLIQNKTNKTDAKKGLVVTTGVGLGGVGWVDETGEVVKEAQNLSHNKSWPWKYSEENIVNSSMTPSYIDRWQLY